MTTSQARGIKQDGLTDLSVAEYLQTHPDFFERNGPLLMKLRLPHLRDAGATVSLVERQVEVLRERNQSLERKLKELVDVARANDALADRIHRLSQRLIKAHNLLEAINAAAGRFLRVDDAAGADIKTFESLLQAGKPRCGQVRDSQRDYLFGKDSIEIGSVALTPLGPKGALGILAIGASDADRFHPAMSTEFLSRIGELVTYALIR
jgi:uncharacterized protein YigA (DUF484 family)